MGKLFDGLLQSLVLEFNVQPTKAVFTLCLHCVLTSIMHIHSVMCKLNE